MDAHGALLVDKPCGPTSHDIVAFVRRTLKMSRVGHTGTLDPLATGLLVILVGHATRLSQFLVADEKEYIADVRLGIATPTYDAQGLEEAFRLKAEATHVEAEAAPDQHEPRGFRLQAEDVERVLDEFRGTFMQTPPPFSAKKIDGVAAYKKARKNQPVELKAVEVTVRELVALPRDRSSNLDPRTSILEPSASAEATADRRSSNLDRTSLLRLRLVVSSGFYVRSLAHDLGQRLGCGAHLEALRRTRSGRFRVEDACTLETLDSAGTAAPCLILIDSLLADMPAVSLTEEGVRRAGHGNSLAPRHVAGRVPETIRRLRLLDAAGEVLAIGERRDDGLLHPLVVLR